MKGLSDASFVAGLVQAVATVVAVLVGYLLSSFTERRMSERQTRERLRDRWLETSISFIDSVAQVVERGKAVDDAASRRSSRDGNEVVSAAARQAFIEARRNRVEAVLSDLVVRRREVSRALLSLRIVNAPLGVVVGATECLDLVEAVKNEVEASLAVEDGPTRERVRELEANLEAAVERLTDRIAAEVGGARG